MSKHVQPNESHNSDTQNTASTDEPPTIPMNSISRDCTRSKKLKIRLPDSARWLQYETSLRNPGAHNPNYTASTTMALGRNSCIYKTGWDLSANLSKTTWVYIPTCHMIRRHARNITPIPSPHKRRVLNPAPCTSTSSRSDPTMDVGNLTSYAEDGVFENMRHKHQAQGDRLAFGLYQILTTCAAKTRAMSVPLCPSPQIPQRAPPPSPSSSMQPAPSSSSSLLHQNN